MDKEVAKIYGNKVRVRACGLCWDGPRLLMVNHKGITSGSFWAPPGGGVEFGQTTAETLKKEFLEETGLAIKPGPFLFGCEYIGKPIHSIELFFEVTRIGGELKTGSDPEIQIIEEVRYLAETEIWSAPAGEIHGIFKMIKNIEELRSLSGFYMI
jgi:8-oxo-dGTP diphosphatase